MAKKAIPRIDAFALPSGAMLAGKYEVVDLLGAGWEGEVYRIREHVTGIELAAKIFFPHRNIGNLAAKTYATRLHKLRHSSVLIHYVTQEVVTLCGAKVTVLVSEYVEGELLTGFINRQPGKRLLPFEALHLLYAIVEGMADVHRAREYHGDLHTDNVIVTRRGLGFEVKLIDMFYQDQPKQVSIENDVCDLIRLFYDAVGGKRRYSKIPTEFKKLCCGLRRDLILRKYRNAVQLRDYLENMQWDTH